jgi:hypothetical protein
LTEKRVLISRPNHDLITHYLCEWSQEIIDFANNKTILVDDLKSHNANASKVLSHLKKINYDFIIFNGHGNPKQVTGHNDVPIITSGENHELLKNKIVYCLSCSCAKELGQTCTTNGTGAFIGYKNDFALLRDKNMTTRPLSDVYAKPILSSTNKIPLTILKGQKVEEAVRRAKEAYTVEIEQLQGSESETGAGNLVMVLIWDLTALELCGDKDAFF